jgi:hypothetical protein
MRRSFLAFLIAVLAGCATLAQDTLDRRYGRADPTRFDHPLASAPGVSYRADVQPILERRCVVCHGCYDAPCQLKLGAWEGIARGASKDVVYDADRVLAAPPSRLFVDAELPSQWRERGFFPVLNERTPTPEANLAASVLYRSLALKRDHPLPAEAVLPKPFDFSLDRAQSCPRLYEYDDYARKYPLGGMPYGLPGLEPRELETVAKWLAAGSPYEGPEPVSAAAAREIAAWEAFLNGNSLKERLMSRYLYEHLFLGHLYFPTDPAKRAFRIIRSGAAPGAPAVPIATRRPYDDPGVARVFYRIVPEGETILAKTHMPYALDAGRMEKYRGWFLAAKYEVAALPSYERATASNPFLAFQAIPVDSRYRFLLDEAHFFIMNFIKGPVCRGQVAVDVIDDRFWVFFVDPAQGADEATAELLAREASNLSLPAQWGSDDPAVIPWVEYADREKRYLRAKSSQLSSGFSASLARIWSGDGANPNAALTIFRHFDNASVVPGLVGGPPKTTWVIGYPLFERIYYLLVAGYDVYGNVGHQLNSRLYMDFMRMEGEFNFLMLLPKASRGRIAEYWYRGAPGEAQEYVYGRNAYYDRETSIEFRTADPQVELYGMLQNRVAPVLGTRFDLSTVADASLRSNLAALAAVRGASLQWIPEVSFLRVDAPGRPAQYFTLLRDTAHSNVAHLFREKSELLPAENRLTVVPGFIGAYPNAMYRVTPSELPALTAAIAGLGAEADYRRLADRFAVRRTNPAFWASSDALIDAYALWAPLEAGLFDYGRLENR